jgi:hypothetical protein
MFHSQNRPSGTNYISDNQSEPAKTIARIQAHEAAVAAAAEVGAATTSHNLKYMNGIWPRRRDRGGVGVVDRYCRPDVHGYDQENRIYRKEMQL